MSKQDDFFDQAEAGLDAEQAKAKEQDAAEWWNFEGKGGEEAAPKFRGTFEEATFIEKEGDNGKYTCLLAYLRDGDDTLFKAWFSAGAAVRGFQDAAPAVGSLILINYLGQVESNRTKGRKFKDYKIVADKQDEGLWNSYIKAFYARTQGATSSPVVAGVRPLDPGEAPF